MPDILPSVGGCVEGGTVGVSVDKITKIFWKKNLYNTLFLLQIKEKKKKKNVRFFTRLGG